MPKAITERIIDRDFRRVGSNLTESDIIAIIQSYIDNPTDGDAPPETPTGSDPSMTVTPEDNISVAEYSGRTFTGSQVYTLTNTGTASLTWTAVKGRTWVDLSATTGTLAAGASTTVTVSINETEAALLAKGEYIDLIIFNAVNA